MKDLPGLERLLLGGNRIEHVIYPPADPGAAWHTLRGPRMLELPMDAILGNNGSAVTVTSKLVKNSLLRKNANKEADPKVTPPPKLVGDIVMHYQRDYLNVRP